MKFINWKTPEKGPVVSRTLLAAGCTPLLAAVLQLRGLGDPAAARAFLRGGRELLSDPMALQDMAPAVERLDRAIRAGEYVAVYGDYDVDGITAACLLSDYLRSRGLRCRTYIPDRIREGYGLNAGAIESLHRQGVTLIVTVDCGVTNLEEAVCAASYGMDLIITDHHECRDALPAAVAVVDPKRADGDGTGANLAGVGVAFKLVCAMERDDTRMLDRYADLVAVGTVADVMPLLGENRFITGYGLQKIASGRCRPGFRALLREAGADGKPLTASTVGYTLAPRINAAGRLGKTPMAVDLLETEDPREASQLAWELCSQNRERQALELAIWEEATAALRGTEPQEPIVLAAEHWHPGVIGIVASRLTETFGVPAVMICLDGEQGKGSCRSTGSFNLYEALSACGDCLERYGGHAMAAGITVRRDRVDEFRRRLADYYRDHPDKSVPALEPEMMVDDPALLTMECVASLDRLEPCGNANPRPLLYMEGAAVEAVIPIGGGKHLRLQLCKFGQRYDCVFFSQTQKQLGVRAGEKADIVFTPQINDFRGRRTVQLVLTDVRPHK